jgi:hypothetical protein
VKDFNKDFVDLLVVGHDVLWRRLLIDLVIEIGNLVGIKVNIQLLKRSIFLIKFFIIDDLNLRKVVPDGHIGVESVNSKTNELLINVFSVSLSR